MRELKWTIGKSGTKLDEPPFRAYFYWTENGQLIQAIDFSETELEVEISKRTVAGENADAFRDALKKLYATIRV